MNIAESVLTPSLETFYAVATHALVRAEKGGHVPERFTGRGRRRWEQFANELTVTDLLDLSIRDTAAAYPIPFGSRTSLPGYDESELALEVERAHQLITQGLEDAELSTMDYLYQQAQRLGIAVPRALQVTHLPKPEPHHKVLELPGTGGWLTYHLLSQGENNLYLRENFVIACEGWEQVMLAGLIAFTLNAPPNQALPITEQPLLELLQEQRYDWIIGLQGQSGNLKLTPFVSEPERVVLL